MRLSRRRLGYLLGAAAAGGVLVVTVAGSTVGSVPASAKSVARHTVAAKRPVVRPAQLTVTPADRLAAASPADPVTVSARGGTLRAVAVTGPAGGIAGALDPTRTSWRSTGPLKYATTYRVAATATNTRGVPATLTSTFTTARPGNLTHAYVTPGDGAVVGIGQPVVVHFDEPIPDRAAALRALTVTTTPAVTGSWGWLDSQTAHWRPAKYWPPHTRVGVTAALYGRPFGGGLYGQDDTVASFTVGDAWVAVGNVHTHTLAIYHNNALVRTMPASFGRRRYPTHDGVHVVMEKHPLYLMNSSTWGLPADAPGGYKDFKAYWATRISSGGEFVHANDGTRWAQGNSNVTHGCVNLTSSNAHWFYQNFTRGDLVIIVGGSPMLALGDGVADWNVSWARWVAGSF